METFKFRVRPFFKTSLLYLEWKELCADVNKEHAKQFVLDKVVMTIQEKLSNYELKIHMDSFKGYRHDLRFSLSKQSNDFIREFAKKNQLYIAEALEIILYVYCSEFLSTQEIKDNGLHNWQIGFQWVSKDNLE
ncbi:hypothetical protein ACEK07_00195 [Alcanivoracaceae bacterium MT1]